MTMKYRLFGQTGLRVSELLLGTMTLDDPAESRRIVDAYADAGGNVLDTASAYGAGEELLGSIVRRRDRFVIGTKYTLSRDAADPNASGNHRKNLAASLDRSLRRLRTDYVDVYWVHIWDRHTPVEETMRALDDAVRAGKVLYTGISDAPAWVVARANTLAQWRDWTPFAGLQVPYNLLTRDVERELLPMAEALGLSVTAWAPLAAGKLTGAAGRRADPASLTERERAAARAVREVADELGARPAQVALAWTRAKSRAVLPLVGVSSVAQLTENLEALDLTLPDDAVRRLEAAVAFELGFPGDFIAECEPSPFVFGDTATRVEPR
ncbi:aryl-alcohol dehydrogenase-like predicted oxidoreductase [Saccharothrix carnea]|uniref:Aryl-alcohol dehydrogenase-like predicted oxidoreductase n=1 Tax=Saccharothrix carnea TaxID=1280637 RepID=A0A2P8I176_SACCR|nr:aldo/keto reductase [Saccharothrix carnea]PSL52183.1 aryl-alcohol dehydrogenase-like predicted oxidoreductase [Saccharothrix carnea]